MLTQNCLTKPIVNLLQPRLPDLADAEIAPGRKGWRYVVALVVCLAFYFPVTFVTLGPVEKILESLFTDPKGSETVTGLFPIVWRTLLAWVGIGICLLWVLRLRVAVLWRHTLANLPAAFAVFGLFIVLMFLWDVGVAVATSSGFNVNVEAFGTERFAQTVVFFLAACLLVPLHALAEEVMYRAFPLRGIHAMSKQIWLAIGVSTVLFWLNHGVQHPVYWLAVGALLGVLAVRTKTVIYTWAVHAAFNFYNAEIISNATVEYNPALLFRDAPPDRTLMLAGSVVCVALVTILVERQLRAKTNLPQNVESTLTDA